VSCLTFHIAIALSGDADKQDVPTCKTVLRIRPAVTCRMAALLGRSMHILFSLHPILRPRHQARRYKLLLLQHPSRHHLAYRARTASMAPSRGSRAAPSTAAHLKPPRAPCLQWPQLHSAARPPLRARRCMRALRARASALCGRCSAALHSALRQRSCQLKRPSAAGRNVSVM
jgi:hypothetical protein